MPPVNISSQASLWPGSLPRPFPIYLQWKEKERWGGEGKGCVSLPLQLAHQSNRTGRVLSGAPEGTPVKAWCHSRCPLLTCLNNHRRSCLSSVCAQPVCQWRGARNSFFRPPMVLSAFPGTGLTCMALLINISTPSFFFFFFKQAFFYSEMHPYLRREIVIMMAQGRKWCKGKSFKIVVFSPLSQGPGNPSGIVIVNIISTVYISAV